MRCRTAGLCLVALSFFGCASGEDGSDPFDQTDSAAQPGAMGTLGGTTGATPDGGGLVDAGPIVPGTAGGMGVPTPGGIGGTASMGGTLGGAPITMNDAGGADASRPPPAGEGGVMLPPGAMEPIIPEPVGECPQFKSGTQMIGGLNVNVVAGTPGATKGPLLFTWHGTGGTGAGALRQLPASVQKDITDQGGMVIAPSDIAAAREGMDVTFVLGVWYDVGDLKMADQIVACAVKNHNIDPRRIYVTGCSAGGLMAGVMTLTRSKYVAASAPNSGGIATPGAWKLQDPMRVPAVMTMHGGSGDTVITNFQETSGYLVSALKPAGAFLVDCNHMAGHCLAPAALHERAWEFMKAHPFGIGTSPYKGGLPANFPSYCTIK